MKIQHLSGYTRKEIRYTKTSGLLQNCPQSFVTSFVTSYFSENIPRPDENRHISHD